MNNLSDITYKTELTTEQILKVSGLIIRNTGDTYLVTLKHDKGATVRFRKGYYGIGQTIQEAWYDLLTKKRYYLPEVNIQ